MITKEEGPGSIFSELRYKLGAESDLGPTEWDNMDSWGKLVSCPYCLSVWVGAFFAILSILFPRATKTVLLALAGSGVAVLIEELLETR